MQPQNPNPLEQVLAILNSAMEAQAQIQFLCELRLALDGKKGDVVGVSSGILALIPGGHERWNDGLMRDTVMEGCRSMAGMLGQSIRSSVRDAVRLLSEIETVEL
jgi:hypothetical protein